MKQITGLELRFSQNRVVKSKKGIDCKFNLSEGGWPSSIKKAFVF